MPALSGEHEKKIQRAIYIQDRKEGVHFVALVQKAPANVRDKVAVGSDKKVPVAGDGALLFFTLPAPPTYILKGLTVYYEIEYYCQQTYD